MIIRKDDLTNESINIGLWSSLCEFAGISVEESFNEEIEIEITKARKETN